MAFPNNHSRKKAEYLNNRVPVLFTDSQMEELRSRVLGGDVSSFIRASVKAALSDKSGNATGMARPASPEPLTLPFVGEPQCGPWADMIRNTDESFRLEGDAASHLDAHLGDIVVRARGDSMAAAGIVDGTLVVMAPLPPHKEPRRGEIVLVQAELPDGLFQQTLKRWRGLHEGVPQLEDGEGHDYQLPPGATGIHALAVARGAITAY